jgi:hypothetical protein
LFNRTLKPNQFLLNLHYPLLPLNGNDNTDKDNLALPLRKMFNQKLMSNFYRNPSVLKNKLLNITSIGDVSNTHVTNFLNTSQNYKLVIPDSGNAVILPAEQNLREYSFSTPTLFNVALETP